MDENNNHVHDENCQHDDETIMISFDNGKDVECAVLGIFEVDSKEYMALMQVEDEGVLFFNYTLDGEEYVIDSIELDEEYDKVADEFFAMYDNGDFDDDDEEDEDEE